MQLRSLKVGCFGGGTGLPSLLGGLKTNPWLDRVNDIVITEVEYYGDVIRNTRQLEPGEGLNPNVEVNNSISIVADQYANSHFLAIRYIRWEGVLWTVTSVEVRRPRLILSLGNVYNGPVAS